MSLKTARAIFAVPPFPGASPHPVVREAEASSPEVSPAQLIAALRMHQVGGEFWQPDWLPRRAGPGNTRPTFQGSAQDPMALISAIHGVPTILSGDGPFAPLSGLNPETPQTEAALELLIATELLAGLAYFDPFTAEPTDPLSLIATLGAWRQQIDQNSKVAAIFGFAHWKRDTAQSLLWGGKSLPFRPARPSILEAVPTDSSVIVWKARVPPAFLRQLESGPWRLIEAEDGFIRSAGLGANCVPPLSIVLDDLGVHYDPNRANRLESMLATGDFTDAEVDRARHLREWLVQNDVSKYGIGHHGAAPARPAGQRRHILVVGQVEDDRSVQFGMPDLSSNLAFLQRVRAAEPDAYLIYRPHPDVESGHRKGAIAPGTALQFADAIEPSLSISALIDMVDALHVMTSLAGFEALLRGKPVTVHGMPFFAGWGLTHDLLPCPPRRGRLCKLDELVAATLIRYPLYLDPVTNLPCTTEIMVKRLLTGIDRQNGALVPLRRFMGWMKRVITQIVGMR